MIEQPLDGESVQIRWERDGTYTPACPACFYTGKARPTRSQALAAVGQHVTGREHRRRLRHAAIARAQRERPAA